MEKNNKIDLPTAETKDIDISKQIKIPRGILETLSPDHALTKLSRVNWLPNKIAYWVTRLLIKLNAETEKYTKSRQALVMKYCDKDADGKPIPLPPEVDGNGKPIPGQAPGQITMIKQRAEFIEALNKLLNEDVDLGISRILLPLSLIPDGFFSPVDMIGLEPFIDIIED
jgi:hypothetical protein